MGTFEGIFNTDENGVQLFYPSGPYGRGYALPDEETKVRIKQSMRKVFLISILFSVGCLAIWNSNITVFVCMFTIVGFFRFKLNGFAKGLPVLVEKRPFVEGMILKAKSFNLVFLSLYYILLIAILISFVLDIFGIGFLGLFDDPEQHLEVGLITLVLLFNSVVFGWMIFINIREKIANKN